MRVKYVTWGRGRRWPHSPYCHIWSTELCPIFLYPRHINSYAYMLSHIQQYRSMGAATFVLYDAPPAPSVDFFSYQLCLISCTRARLTHIYVTLINIRRRHPHLPKKKNTKKNHLKSDYMLGWNLKHFPIRFCYFYALYLPPLQKGWKPFDILCLFYKEIYFMYLWICRCSAGERDETRFCIYHICLLGIGLPCKMCLVLFCIFALLDNLDLLLQVVTMFLMNLTSNLLEIDGFSWDGLIFVYL